MKILKYLNLPKIIADHLLGEDHPHPHRMVVGVFVMTTGVAIAKSGHAIDATAWLITADVIGYAVHGLGFTPYLEWLIQGTKAQGEQTKHELEFRSPYPKLDLLGDDDVA